MGRPLSATDEDILNAAQTLMEQHGPDAFSVSQVAREVGLSRTAIALRFKNADNLRDLAVAQMTKSFERHLEDFVPDSGARGLLKIAELIGQMTNGRERFTSFMIQYPLHPKMPDEMARQEKRGGILRRLVKDAMPETALPLDQAVDAFMAHIFGTLMAWQVGREESAAIFLRERTRAWLRLARINDEAGE